MENQKHIAQRIYPHDELIELTREIKEMYDKLEEVLPMIKDIHQYIKENGWNNK